MFRRAKWLKRWNGNKIDTNNNPHVNSVNNDNYTDQKSRQWLPAQQSTWLLYFYRLKYEPNQRFHIKTSIKTINPSINTTNSHTELEKWLLSSYGLMYEYKQRFYIDSSIKKYLDSSINMTNIQTELSTWLLSSHRLRN